MPIIRPRTKKLGRFLRRFGMGRRLAQDRAKCGSRDAGREFEFM